ncbi:MAG: chemotaxis protein CheB [Candidatus Eremiobacteraeota bacterium]|nr:chemotaxis protein CheB [Candidatus Eremiobacteraeota bacterium]
MESHNGELRVPVVMIGGSAGALEPLQTIVSRLPQDVGAAIFITMHVPPDSASALPHILTRAGTLFATHGIDGAPIAANRIIIAPPNHHLFIEGGTMRVSHGPRENNHRPSIDVLFRSGAHAAGPAACGVIISGTLDDGVAGLVAISRAGGLCVAQDPSEAQFPDMPTNAINTGVVNEVRAASAIPETILAFLSEAPVTESVDADTIAPDERAVGRPSIFTCPECKGTLWELDGEDYLRYRCRTGHAFSPHAMLSNQREVTEAGFWTALRALEERRDLLLKIGSRSRQRGDRHTAGRMESAARQIEHDIVAVEQAIHQIIRRQESAS